MSGSDLLETLAGVCSRSAAAVVARGRLANSALNATLLRRLSAAPGMPDSLLSEPVFEAARAWEQAPERLGDLAGALLHPDLVAALDGAAAERMPRDRYPYAHQLAAWRHAREGLSCLVTSGTGSGKTECFMVPVLDDLLRDDAKGRLSGVRAIIIYPLNALIESQRERLAAWTEALKNRITFALYNGLTPERKAQVKRELAAAELGDRRSIRESPPAVLITNVTMLEYLLLRAQDRSILERSQGLLRWIVLDEAHGYIGAQAAEMALLLRRVRAAFGVQPEDVRLIATSATISEGESTEGKLRRFAADLAGIGGHRVRVIAGREAPLALPEAGADTPLDHVALASLTSEELWNRLAPHPRVHRLTAEMKSRGLRLSEVGEILLDDRNATEAGQAILDAAAKAEQAGRQLLPWRAHLFERAQGGLWVCVDPACTLRDPELAAPDAQWGFGAVWFAQRDHCACGAPVFEILGCSECGTPHLIAGREVGPMTRLVPHRGETEDDFAVDAEPDPENEAEATAHDTVWLRPARGDGADRHLSLKDSLLYDNGAPEGTHAVPISVIEDARDRACCAGAGEARLQPQRYGPPFLIGNALPLVLERLAAHMPEPGLPLQGRRAISFSDSRQGVARLSAKLQQDAERTLTRAFLYHAVQEGQALPDDERAKLEKKLELFRSDPDQFADEIVDIERRLAGEIKPIRWAELTRRFGAQVELRQFATEVWRERGWGGARMAAEPEKLAEMFLYRELFRRPRVQNNVETMGLVRLTFPEMEARARLALPQALKEVGAGPETWVGLAQAAVDLVFRDVFAVDIQDDGLARWINPRLPGRRSVFPADTPRENVTDKRPVFWPVPQPRQGRMSRLLRLVYRLIGRNPENSVDQDRAREVLDALWDLISATAAKDTGRGARRLDFEKVAVARFDYGWHCPITRRVLGYNTGGVSPYGPEDPRPLTPVAFPRLPRANAGGLAPEDRTVVERWCAADPTVSGLRKQGHWTDLHDRIAAYAPFLIAQEHSAQIERPILELYEGRFKEGRINLLACSTTMEMGVDIPNVALVVNANVPPSVTNYRQRVGRAGRRGEPWAFAMTFCRNLPLDRATFDDPAKFLASRITAPIVRLDSVPIVTRHVHAALLAAFVRTRDEGLNVKASTGAFFGALEAVVEPAPDNLADTFITLLRDSKFADEQAESLRRLTAGTALAERAPADLCVETAMALEFLLRRWRAEYGQLLEGATAAGESEVRQAFEMRAKRMHGEFLLSELARRGFTPSYGFPVDVVSFDHLSGRRRGDDGSIAFGERRGGASRTLDVAIREYAPGAEIVIDGLVHLSEGVQPAWAATADASRLEDLQSLWECRACRGFGLTRIDLEACPQCGAPAPRRQKALRPAGFLGRQAPHTGYENLGHVPFEMPRVSAAGGPWRALPDPKAGRTRADDAGLVVTRGSGRHGRGYALCLSCGRAEPETDEPGGAVVEALKGHQPLAPLRGEQLVRGLCPGGLTRPERIQRNLRLVHETRTDVFELQLPPGTTLAATLALAAGLREAHAEKLGAEAREIGLAVGWSAGASGERCASAFLYDRAAGGAGLVTRLMESEWLAGGLARAAEWLDCREACDNGCPACILRPDLNFGEDLPDRRGGLALARDLRRRLELPPAMQLFGPTTRLVGAPLADWLERERLAGRLQALTVYLHGTPADWELAVWPARGVLVRLAESSVETTLVVASSTLTDEAFELGQKLALNRLAARATVAHVPVLPRAGSAPIVALAATKTGVVAIAAGDPAEAIAGPDWGLGSRAPLVHGPASPTTTPQAISIEQLVAQSAGNARIIWINDDLDGPLAGFGARFWSRLAKDDPLTLATLKSAGVADATYCDRYLLSPLQLRLLHELIAALPGKVPTMGLTIEAARRDRPPQASWALFHDFPDDWLRREVAAVLFPGAVIMIGAKASQPHSRSLVLRLGDGRQVRLLLDQGVGAWRCAGPAPHDFRATPQAQARDIARNSARVRIGEARGTPMVLEFS